MDAPLTAPPTDSPDLALRQVAAIDAFHLARRSAQAAAAAVAGGREARMDAARRLEVLQRQHAALVARCEQALADSRSVLSAGRPRVVVVNRHAWAAARLATALEARGFAVVAEHDNGADAVGTVVAEQPDVVLLEDPLLMMPCATAVQEVLQYSPGSVVAVSADARATAPLLAAGASVVVPRQTPPEKVADEVVGALQARARTTPAQAQSSAPGQAAEGSSRANCVR